MNYSNIKKIKETNSVIEVNSLLKQNWKLILIYQKENLKSPHYILGTETFERTREERKEKSVPIGYGLETKID